MSNEQIYRPPQSDEAVINQKLGGFKHFLQLNGIPTPSKAELRLLLYTQLMVDWMKMVQEHNLAQQKKIMSDPRLPQALKFLEDQEKEGDRKKEATKVEEAKTSDENSLTREKS